MQAVYSLYQAPPTHDFVNWLARVNEERKLVAAPTVDITIVPGVRMFSDRDKYYTQARRTWRIENLLMPLARLAPFVGNITLGDGIQHLSYGNPGRVMAPIFRAPEHAKQIVEKCIPKNAVTITLRQSDFEPSRNTNLAEWVKVADWLVAEGYTPVFIPDAEADMRCDSEPTGHAEYLPASHNFAMRLALWEHAKLNLMTNSGPMLLALHSDIPLLCFKLYVPQVKACQKPHLIASAFSPEHDWSTGAHRKQLYWEEDTAKNIIPILAERLNDKQWGKRARFAPALPGCSKGDPAPTLSGVSGATANG